MRGSSWLGSSVGDLTRLLLTTLPLLPGLCALSFTAAPSPNLDLSQLGRVAFAGDFDSVSLYDFSGQNEDGLNANGSQSILGRFPSGTFAELQSADAAINTMCTFTMSNGTMNGVIIGGNFTSLGGQPAQAVGLFNPNTGQVVPLPGLTGQVNSVVCDNQRETVYFGGSFDGGGSTNAIAWTTHWSTLPFSGFNGPVKSVAQLPNGNIVFAGSFTGLGNQTAPAVPNAQIVNIDSATITAGPTSSNASFANSSAIVCNTPSLPAANNEWLAQDNVPAYWEAAFGFTFQPTKIRLLNAKTSGYGTQTWRFTALPLNGILELSYYDSNGKQQSCYNECPLAQNTSYQDFYFVRPIMMNSFRLDMSAWYGNGVGLAGIELYQNDIYSFAVNTYNEPLCDHVSNGSQSTNVGSWSVQPAGTSNAGYLSAYLPTGDVPPTDYSVTFEPDIQQSGNYSIIMWTPGCIADNTCSSRGQVNITGTLAPSSTTGSTPLSMTLYQSNNYDKYDQIYYGYVEAGSSSFRPTVTLTPSVGQGFPLTVVAQRVQFTILTSTGGLNGLYEYNPNESAPDTKFANSPTDSAGNSLNPGAQINSIVVVNGVTYAGGTFSGPGFSNAMAVENGNATSLGNGGLNHPVQQLYSANNIVYFVGNFTGTNDGSVKGLNNIAQYDISSKTWKAVGAGVNGIVFNAVPLTVNISTTDLNEPAIAFAGYFDQVNSFGSNPALDVHDIAVWVPAKNNWLQNLNPSSIFVAGRVTAETSNAAFGSLWAGSLDSQQLAASGVVSLTTSGNLNLQQVPFKGSFPTASSPMQKRAATQPQISGVKTGIFYEANGLNLTILGGQFSVTATNGSTISDLAIINNTDSSTTVTGLTNESSKTGAILALATSGSTLFAGGSVSNGLIVYDLAHGLLASTQPPALSGGSSTVNVIAPRPSSAAIYVGGSFTSAGSLNCVGLCNWDSSVQQWNQVGAGLLSSSTVNVLQWASNNKLIIAGDIQYTGNKTTMASYDTTTQAFTAYTNAGNLSSVPGPITALTATDNSYSSFFVSGIANNNNSAYITHFDGQNTWTGVSGLGAKSFVDSLQVLSITSGHGDTSLLSSNQVLMVTGQLQLANYGNVSAALFNGTDFTPLALTTMADGGPGRIYGAFVQNPGNLLNNFVSHLALGFIVLIALAIALALVFLLVIIGIIAERIRRRREGYVPAPTNMVEYEKGGGHVGDIPPEALFSGIHGGAGTGPRL